MNATTTKTGVNDFPHTRDALDAYDAGASARNRAWRECATAEDVLNATRADRAALELVQAAFCRDTEHVNRADHCALADLPFMRLMAFRAD
jgi:hypothetical protein